MKKIFLMTVMASLLMCAGCANKSESNVGSAGDNSSSKVTVSASVDGNSADEAADSASEVTDSSAEVSLAGMLPDASAIFEEATFDVVSDGEKIYCFTVDGYKDGEYDKYVEACKDIFTDVKFDTHTDSNNKFEAKTEDGKYYVSVQLIFEQNSFTVTCGVSRT